MCVCVYVCVSVCVSNRPRKVQIKIVKVTPEENTSTNFLQHGHDSLPPKHLRKVTESTGWALNHEVCSRSFQNKDSA